MRGSNARDAFTFWPAFFYRFVEPAKRSGDRLNYAERIRSATATVLGSGWAIYRCPPLRDRKAGQ
jgi:hypothetical protein